jgi:Icc-related predicted phosphoesterase
VFLFATQPAHKGLHRAGSEALAVLISTYRPRLAIVPGDAVAETRLGTTLVVHPGRLEQGEYALIDLHDRSVQPRMLVD